MRLGIVTFAHPLLVEKARTSSRAFYMMLTQSTRYISTGDEEEVSEEDEDEEEYDEEEGDDEDAEANGVEGA